MKRLIAVVPILLVFAVEARAAEPRIPVIHSTDLFHPHADPDDHYDLATAFAVDEFDLKAVILDMGEQQSKRSGARAVRQMNRITGREVPHAIGLSRRFRTRTDTGLDEPEEFQAGVKLILSVLRDSPEKVVITTTGSCRDVAAAFNRRPELLREKVRAVYFNIGSGPNEPQREYNVGCDPLAYLRMFETGLPLYWCPCFGNDGYQTLFRVDQKEVVGACGLAVQNYFVYCLTRSKEDPIAFLTSGPHPLPTGGRNMWCTAPMLHAAGRKIYRRGQDDFVALRPEVARQQGLADRGIEVFRFVPIRVTLDEGSPPRPVKPPPPEPKPGRLTAVFAGREHDRVGTGSVEPDGRPDCRVRVLGVDPQRPIRNVVLTGPDKGRWELVETGRWWRVTIRRDGRQLDGYFQFWAAGEHRIEITYADGSTQAATFTVPGPAPAQFRVEFSPAKPNAFVFRATHPRYREILGSCLKNLLAGLGR